MNKKGITLIALVITIIILLILAGVTIGSINSGLFDYAKKAKTDTQEATTIEEIENSYIIAKGNSRTGRVTASDMQSGLDEVFGTNDVEAIDNGDTIVVKIDDQYYEIDNSGHIGAGQTLEANSNPGDITKGGTCIGTESNPYRIECIEDLVAFSQNVNNGTAYSGKYVVLTRDLDFNSIFSYNDYKAKYEYVEVDDAYEPNAEATATIRELCTSGKGFIPIGKSGKAFSGTFQGNEEQKEIKNIFINRESDAALFGNINGKIYNITLTGHIVSTNSKAAGFIATGSATLEKCYNKAKIEGQTSAAGICGTGNPTITKSGNEGEIICHGSGSTNAAGIAVGWAKINKCYNTGSVTNDGGELRGAVGICPGTAGKKVITNCYNTGDIMSMTGATGGITSWSTETISNCYNTGEISGPAIYNYNSGVARNKCFWWRIHS